MKSLVQTAIRRPVATAVGVLLVALFGGLALWRIPVQLTPLVEAPRLSILTEWPGASPLEVERELVEPQEERLEDLEGLARLESSSSDGLAVLHLTFRPGTDMETVQVRVANRLQQVEEPPAEAERPVVEVVGSATGAVAWFMLTPAGDRPFDGDVTSLGGLAHERIRPVLERVPGVARVQILGAREPEMQVVVDPARLAARQVTLVELVDALERENRNLSGGDFDEGKRRYVVRTTGELRSAEEIAEVVVGVRDGVPVTVAHVAGVRLGFREHLERGFYMGRPTLGVRVQKRPGADVLGLMAELQAEVARLDAELLEPLGLRLEQTYDETEYITSAISLVRQSLLLGGALAIGVLLLFLRSRATTLVVAVSIPVSVLGTFLLLAFLGRTLNVVSMAGLAFAVGMVVDNSIVVLENVYRHRQMGKSRRRAAAEGTREVSGAVLAATLTTIAVFLPILFIEEEAGQLFRDLAIAISCAVAWSLLVALTLIPSLSARLLETAPPRGGHAAGAATPRDAGSLAKRLAERVSHAVYWLCGGVLRRLAVVVGFTAAAIGLSWWLMPAAEYLPEGNRNQLLGVVSPPPGYNVEEAVRLHDPFLRRLEPLWREPAERTRDLPGGGIRSFFFVASPESCLLGARARSPRRLRELLPVVRDVGAELPGARLGVGQTSIFADGLAQGRNIDLDLLGPDLDRLLALGSQVLERTLEAIPGAQARPVPQLDLGSPEVRVIPDRRRTAELGLSSRDLGLVVSALVDGVQAGEYHHEGRQIDLRVIAATERGAQRTHLLEQLPIATPGGRVVTLGSVARVTQQRGPVEIRRLDRARAVTIQVQPPADVPLEQAMATLERRVIEPLRASGALGGLHRARLSGSADRLVEIARALRWDFLLAVLITYLLMAALFESFLYPVVILFSVPLAALGGFLGLALLDLFVPQSLDVLTMLGFIVLVGTVVNNAILIVHQALNHRRLDEMSARDAVTAATRNRVRPIFMSVATSVLGMLPLVLVPGAGSELYRGLGSVVVGGLVFEARSGLFRRLRRDLGRRAEESRQDWRRYTADSSATGAALDPSGKIHWR